MRNLLLLNKLRHEAAGSKSAVYHRKRYMKACLGGLCQGLFQSLQYKTCPSPKD